jgi:7-carboxy-7-deazaguanine synthase
VPRATSLLRISEIFHSIQGESTRIGQPTTFVRLTGCPLRCVWCDTAYAFSGGNAMSIAAVLERVAELACPLVCVTGGEPLAQGACRELLQALCDAGYSVSLETSGALDISAIDPRVARIMDIKAPGSREDAKNRWENLALLTAHDEIKIVLADEADYHWAAELICTRRLDQQCTVLLSPVWESLPPAKLAEWILRDHLPVRLQVQLHKVLWGSERGK